MKKVQESTLCILLTAIFLCLPVASQDRFTENTLKLEKGQRSPAATIRDVAWLAGRWIGSGMGGRVEEIWSPPQNGSMMGMFRYIRNERTIFYEIMTLVEDNGSVTLRLKHFHPNLKGWEEKDVTVDFPLVRKNEATLFLEGLTYKSSKNGAAMKSYVAIREESGSVHEEVFSFKKAR